MKLFVSCADSHFNNTDCDDRKYMQGFSVKYGKKTGFWSDALKAWLSFLNKFISCFFFQQNLIPTLRPGCLSAP